MHTYSIACLRTQVVYCGGLAANRRPVAAWRAVLLAQSRARTGDRARSRRSRSDPLDLVRRAARAQRRARRRLRMQDSAAERCCRAHGSAESSPTRDRGLVERRPDPDDGRGALATITPAGRAALKRTAPIYLAGIDRALQPIPDPDRTTRRSQPPCSTSSTHTRTSSTPDDEQTAPHEREARSRRCPDADRDEARHLRSPPSRPTIIGRGTCAAIMGQPAGHG